MFTSEFWALSLICALIQSWVEHGKLNAIAGSTLIVLAVAAYGALRAWLKAHHTSHLADLALSALDARAGADHAHLLSLGRGLANALLDAAVDAAARNSNHKTETEGGSGQPGPSGEIAAHPSAGPGSPPATQSPGEIPAARSGSGVTGGYIARSLAVALSAALWIGLAAILALAGCAELTVRDAASGKTKLKVQSNAKVVNYSDGATSLYVEKLDNSTPTTAAWNGGNQFAGTVATGIVNGVLAKGLTQGMAAGAATGTGTANAVKLLPAATVGVTQNLTKPKPAPTATPAPATPAPHLTGPGH